MFLPKRKVTDTGAVAISMAAKTRIMIERVTKTTVMKAMAMKAMGMKAMGIMTATTRLCMAGTRAIGETCRLDSPRRIDCLLAWKGN
jgi:hypothetical protein